MALVKWDQCRDLADYLRSDKRAPPRAQVIAGHVLTHEAMHMAGAMSESGAECAALRRDAETALMLGGTADQARALAADYRRSVYPTLPPDYRSEDCPSHGS